MRDPNGGAQPEFSKTTKEHFVVGMYNARDVQGKPLVNSLFTLGLMIGVSVGDTTIGTLVANLGMTDIKFTQPVFHGDTLRFTTEIVSRRESKCSERAPSGMMPPR